MSNQDNKKKVLSRRDFLKTIGAAGVATTGLSACVGGGKDGTSTAAAGEIPTDRMTYRTNPTSGDKVSLLGFGMMRLPSVGGRSAREGNEEIDQEMVNELVDYAIAHGVNYFDTSPAYCRGQVGTRHRYCTEPSSARQVFHRHQAVQFLPGHVEPGSLHRHVP